MELTSEMQADLSAHPLLEHTGHNTVSKNSSKVRSSSVPVHSKEKCHNTVLFCPGKNFM